MHFSSLELELKKYLLRLDPHGREIVLLIFSQLKRKVIIRDVCKTLEDISKGKRKMVKKQTSKRTKKNLCYYQDDTIPNGANIRLIMCFSVRENQAEPIL